MHRYFARQKPPIDGLPPELSSVQLISTRDGTVPEGTIELSAVQYAAARQISSDIRKLAGGVVVRQTEAEIRQVRTRLYLTRERVEELYPGYGDHSEINRKVEAIDRKTSNLIEGGFVYEGKRFSLSLQAQMNWLDLGLAGVVPVTVSTMDHQSFIIATAQELSEFLTAARSAKNKHLDDGRALKAAAMVATTAEQLDAVVDDRH